MPARAVMVLLSLHGLSPAQIAVRAARLGGRRLTRRIAALLQRPGPWTLPRIWRCPGRPRLSPRTLYRRVRLVAV